MEQNGIKKIREIKLKEPLNVLSEYYPLLYGFSEIIDIFDEKRDLVYFSNFYEKIRPAVNKIVIYIVDNKLTGLKKAIDEYAFESQKIVKFLKILHSRFLLISNYPMGKNHPDWYVDSQKESCEILKDIQRIINEMLTLRDFSY